VITIYKVAIDTPSVVQGILILCKKKCYLRGSDSGVDEDSSLLGPYGFLTCKWLPKSSGMWHPVNYKHYSQAVGAGMIDCVCRVNWTPVGKAYSEKGSGIPESEFVIREADNEILPWEAASNLLAIITYQKAHFAAKCGKR